MAQLLAMAGANVGHVANDGATALTIAMDKPLTAAWLESVAGFSAVQICVSLGKVAELKALLRRQECNVFALPSLAQLAAENRPLFSLCRAARKPWGPKRHFLFHPAHRSTITVLLLVARRTLGSTKLCELPTEMWFMICAHLGRTNWGGKGKRALVF
jgi:hypothetical protein